MDLETSARLSPPDVFGFFRYFVKFSPFNCGKGPLRFVFCAFSLATFLGMLFRIYFLFSIDIPILTFGWSERNLFAFISFESFSCVIGLYRLTSKNSLRRHEEKLAELKTLRLAPISPVHDDYKKMRTKMLLLTTPIFVVFILTSVYLMANKTILYDTTKTTTWYYYYDAIVSFLCGYANFLFLPCHALLHSAMTREFLVFNEELEEASKSKELLNSAVIQRFGHRQVRLFEFTNFMTERLNTLMTFAPFTALVALVNVTYIVSDLRGNTDILYYLCMVASMISTITIASTLMYPAAFVQEAMLKTSSILMSDPNLQSSQDPLIYRTYRMMVDRSLHNRSVNVVFRIFSISRKNIERAFFIITQIVLVINMEYLDQKCAVCQKSAQGVHFGVETCRACAMFFRRSLKQKLDYQCKRRKENCELRTAEDRLMCKFCRHQKCVDLGMTAKKPAVVKNRYNERVIYDVIDPQTLKVSKLIDVAPIIKRSRLILENHPLPESLKPLRPLQKMTAALKKLRVDQLENPVIVKSLSFRDFFFLWERNMIRCAEWLMCCEEFRQLPRHERMEIFKLVWAVWRRVERKTMAASIFGQRCYDEKILLLSDDVASRVNDFSMDVSEVWSSAYSYANITNMFGDGILQYYEQLVKPQLELRLTTTEVTFVLCQIVWNYAGRRLQGQTQTAGERFLEAISDDLNDYYRQKNWKNYAPRLTRMMQIVNQVLTLQLKQEKLMDLVLLFDLFNFTFSDPAFFCV